MEKKKKVLLFTITYLPITGGSEVAIHEVTKRLCDFHFVIVTGWLDRKLPKHERISENVEVVRVGIPGFNVISKNWYVIAAFLWSLRYAIKFDVDIVWAVLESYGAMAASLLKLFIHDIYYVLTLQDGSGELFWKRRVGWWIIIFKRVYHLADHITAISNYLIKRGREAFGYTGPMSLIPNAASETFYTPISSERRVEIRKLWHVEEKDRVVLGEGRLVEKNGVDTLIEAFAKIKRQEMRGGGRVKLVIIGEGKLRKQLELQVIRFDSESQADYKLQDAIVFMGSVPNEHVHEYFQASDVFCRASRSEGQGISFIEAMASRLVTIGTNVGGIPDFLHNEENGYVVDPDNIDQLAEVLKKSLEDSDQNSAIRERAFFTANQYRWDAIAERYRETFFDVLESVSIKKYLLFRQFVKYTLVGGTAALIDFGVFALLSQVLGVYYLVANILSIAVSGIYNFTLSRKWTFRASDRPPVKQFIAYAISASVYAFLSSGLLALCVEVVGFHEIIGKVVTGAIMWIWSFLSAKYVVFRFF